MTSSNQWETNGWDERQPNGWSERSNNWGEQSNNWGEQDTTSGNERRTNGSEERQSNNWGEQDATGGNEWGANSSQEWQQNGWGKQDTTRGNEWRTNNSQEWQQNGWGEQSNNWTQQVSSSSEWTETEPRWRRQQDEQQRVVERSATTPQTNDRATGTQNRAGVPAAEAQPSARSDRRNRLPRSSTGAEAVLEVKSHRFNVHDRVRVQAGLLIQIPSTDGMQDDVLYAGNEGTVQNIVIEDRDESYDVSWDIWGTDRGIVGWKHIELCPPRMQSTAAQRTSTVKSPPTASQQAPLTFQWSQQPAAFPPHLPPAGASQPPVAAYTTNGAHYSGTNDTPGATTDHRRANIGAFSRAPPAPTRPAPPRSVARPTDSATVTGLPTQAEGKRPPVINRLPEGRPPLPPPGSPPPDPPARATRPTTLRTPCTTSPMEPRPSPSTTAPKTLSKFARMGRRPLARPLNQIEGETMYQVQTATQRRQSTSTAPASPLESDPLCNSADWTLAWVKLYNRSTTARTRPAAYFRNQ